MSKIYVNAALANGAGFTQPQNYCDEDLAIKVVGTMAVAGASPTVAEIIAFIDGMTINTKLTGDVKPMVQSAKLFKPLLLSQYFKGNMKVDIGAVNANAAPITLDAVLVQSNGMIMRQWQVDFQNNTGAAINIELSGSSRGNGNAILYYLPDSLNTGLNMAVPTTFDKIVLDYNFNTIDIVENGTANQLVVEDVKTRANEDDGIIIQYKFNGISQAVAFSDSGYGFFDNNDGSISNFVLHRAEGSGTDVVYMTARAIKVA